MVKKLILKKNSKKLNLKKKTNNTIPKDIQIYHDFLDKQIKLSEEKNKHKPIEYNKKYHYTERMPPNNVSIQIITFSSTYTDNKLPASVFLQYLISESLYYKRKPLYHSWMIKNKTNIKKLKLRRK